MRNILPLAIIVCLVGLVGCSSEKIVPIKGTVILPDDITLRTKGTDQKDSIEDSVAIAFIPSPPDEKITAGSGRITGSDPTFTIQAGTKKGLVPGTYKVTAQLQIYGAGGKGTGSDGPSDDPATEMNKRYGSPGSTKLNFTVTPETTNLIIDLKEGKVTAVSSPKTN